MQMAAATELQVRDWYFHKEIKIWIKNIAGNMEQYDQESSYVYFDPNTWQVLPLTQYMYIDMTKLHDSFKDNGELHV